MREIKFRAWDKKQNKMLGVTEVIWGINGNANFVRTDEYKVEGRITDYTGEDFLILQFTGLKDKNGKEIYEGDIVKSVLHNSNGSLYEIRWDGGAFILDKKDHVNEFYLSKFEDRGYRSSKDGDLLESMEIIGNIYENPELLK